MPTVSPDPCSRGKLEAVGIERGPRGSLDASSRLLHLRSVNSTRHRIPHIKRKGKSRYRITRRNRNQEGREENHFYQQSLAGTMQFGIERVAMLPTWQSAEKTTAPSSWNWLILESAIWPGSIGARARSVGAAVR